MKVRMLRNPGDHLHCDLKEGDTGTVNKQLGEKLIKLRVAEPADEPESEPPTRRKRDAGDSDESQKKEIKAVPPSPTVSKPETNDINKTKRETK